MPEVLSVTVSVSGDVWTVNLNILIVIIWVGLKILRGQTEQIIMSTNTQHKWRNPTYSAYRRGPMEKISIIMPRCFIIFSLIINMYFLKNNNEVIETLYTQI